MALRFERTGHSCSSYALCFASALWHGSLDDIRSLVDVRCMTHGLGTIPGRTKPGNRILVQVLDCFHLVGVFEQDALQLLHLFPDGGSVHSSIINFFL